MAIEMQGAAIACGGVGFKAAFAHGVLTALESRGFRAAAYAGGSLAAIPAMRAAAGVASAAGVTPWVTMLATARRSNSGMSEAVLADIAAFHPAIAKARLFSKNAPRLCVATTAVHTVAGAIETQGPRAGTLGRRLLVHAGRHDRTWASEHLSTHMWDSGASERSHRLTSDNIDEVLYASTRLLHGWEQPAEIDGMPFVEAVYTCGCPAMEVAALGFRDVIAIGSETGPIYRDLFHTAVVPAMAWRSRVHLIRPSLSPKSLGVEELTATEHGLVSFYDHGLDQGLRFIADHLERAPEPTSGWDWPSREE
jgi:hypothetical protein